MQNKNEEVLIIVKNFIPYYPTIGGIMRVLTMCEFFLSRNYKVHVIASQGYFFGYFGYEDLLKRIKVTYIEDKWNEKQSKGFYNNLKNKQTNKKGYGKLFSYYLKLRRKVFKNILIPDIGILVIPKFYSEAKKIIPDNNIKNVIISSPPHSMQLVGLRLKKHFKRNLNLIVDYRDSWNTTNIFRKDYQIFQLISEYQEKKVLKMADYFTFISRPMLDKVEKKYRLDLKDKSRLIMNGYRNLNISDVQVNYSDQKIRIGYFGIVSDDSSSYRNITSLFEVVSENPEIFKDIEFHFYGVIRVQNRDIVDNKVFFIHESLPHKDALNEMKKMDFLMTVHSDPASSDEVITGKFFEYIATQKPILCLSPENMEAKRLIDQYGIGITIDIQNKTEIVEKFKKLKTFKNYDFYSHVDVNVFRRDKQYKKFLDILEN